MSAPVITAGTDRPNPLVRMRAQRIRTFILILVILNAPFLALGLLDLPNSPLGLIRALSAYLFYGIYYLLERAGYGVAATYGCIVALALLIASGAHDTGGFLVGVSALFFLLLVGAGTVLGDERALDVTVMICLAAYGGLALYELAGATPPVFQAIYTTIKPLPIMSIAVVTIVSLVGTWLVMRSNLVGLRRSTDAMERAREEAEQRAHENAALVAQVQASNESLLTTQTRLRETVEALALPLIPLDEGVILLPLVGYLDTGRAEQLVEGLLQGIHEQRAQTVIIDITGLREVDAHAAGALLQATKAARLLGAQVVLSGIGASAARALVELGANMHMLHTAGSLSDALRMVTLPRTEN